MRKRLGSIALLLAAPAAVGALWVMHASEVGAALERIAPGAIAAAVALHVATLALRSEAWRVTLAAAHPERPFPRDGPRRERGGVRGRVGAEPGRAAGARGDAAAHRRAAARPDPA